MLKEFFQFGYISRTIKKLIILTMFIIFVFSGCSGGTSSGREKEKDTIKGVYLWSETFGGTGIDEASSTRADSDGNIYLAGYFTGTANFGKDDVTSTGTVDPTAEGTYMFRKDIFLAKYSPEGSLIWLKTIGGTDGSNYSYDGVTSMAVTPGGEVYITGYFCYTADFGGESVTTVNGNTDNFLAKYSADGVLLWVTSFGSVANDNSYSVAVDSEGNACVTGGFEMSVDFGDGNSITSSGFSDIFLAKYASADGSLKWVKTFGGTDANYGYSVAVDSGDNIYLTGYFIKTVNFGNGNITSNNNSADIFLAKYAPADGSLLWVKTFGGTGPDYGNSVAVDSDDNVYLTGFFSLTADFGNGDVTSNSNSRDIFLAKYVSADGSLLWVKTFGSPSADEGKSIVAGQNGELFLTGFFGGTMDFGDGDITNNGGKDIFLAGFSASTGTLSDVKTFGGSDDDKGISLGVDPDGKYLLFTGIFEESADFGGGSVTSNSNEDIFLIKYD